MGLKDLFSGLFSAKKVDIIAPVSGEIVSLDTVPDEVFSERMVGDGLAIIPTSSVLCAPVTGVIGKIFDTNHAFSMQSDEGVELFVHFGVDTIDLKGQGFKRLAEPGQHVEQGTPVIELDLEFLKANTKTTVTPVVISNMESVKSFNAAQGNVEQGDDVILSVEMN